jgi:hypothetical protein
LSSSKAPRRLQDIIDNAQSIFRYTEGLNLVEFEQNRLVYDAVERCLERICETMVKLGEQAPILSRISLGTSLGRSVMSFGMGTMPLRKTSFLTL